MKFLFFIFILSINLFATVYIGNGSGKSEEEAKRNALKDISSQIFVEIESTITQNKNVTNGVYSKDTHSQSIQKTNANFSDYKLLTLNFEDGVYFARISYENIPSIDKFINKLPKNIATTNKNNFLQKTPMAGILKRKLGVSIDFEIFRKDKHWYIKYHNITQILDKTDFSKLFVTNQSNDLSININKKDNILNEHDEFYFKVTTKKKGYINILTVYEDGTVSILMKNVPIQKNKLQDIPNKDFEEIPVAGLMEDGVDTFDMYIAIHSTKKLYLDNFIHANDDLITDERYKNFDELIYFINEHTFSTLKVITKAR